MDYSILIYIGMFFISFIILKAYVQYENGDAYVWKFKIHCSRFMLMFLLVLIPSLIVGLRYNVGTDYHTYCQMYDNIKGINIIDFFFKYIEIFDVEPTFYLLCRFVFLTFNNVKMLFFICYFITFSIVIVSITRLIEKEDYIFSVFIYFLMYFAPSLNIVRQSMAISFVLLAYSFYLNRDYKKYIFLIIVAFLIHKTAIIFLLFFFMIDTKSKKFNELRKIIFYILIVGSPIFIKFILSIGTHIPILNDYMNKYEVAFDGGGIGFLLFILPVLVPVIYFGKDKYLKESKNLCLFNMYLLQIPLMYLGYFMPWAVRMADYPRIFEIILVPALIKSIENDNTKKVLTFYFIGFYLFYFYYFYIYLGNNQILPYRIG